jgi:CHAT domain-containing protein
MFFYKTALVLAILIVISLCSCRDKKSLIDTAPITDTLSISAWKKAYDSLYDKYYSAKEKPFLKQAGVFADKILQMEQQLLKDTSNQKLFFNILFNRSLDLNDLDDFIKSQELLDKYIYMSDLYELDNTENLAYAQITLANIYSRYGDYKNAILRLQQSLDYYLKQNDQESASSAIFNLSIPYKELGQYENAILPLQKILNFDKIGPKRKAKASFELADIYTRQQNLEEAKKRLEKAKAFAYRITTAETSREDIADIYSSIYNIQAGILAASGKPGEAFMIYRHSLDSITIAKSGNLRDREIGKTYIAMGKAMEQLDHADSALYYYNQALFTVINVDTLDRFSLPLQQDLYAENTITEALFARAECISKNRVEKRKDLENAVSCWQLAFETEKKLLNAFSYDESRLFMVQENRRQVENAIGVCYRLYQETKNSKWADQAFLFAEHNKSFVLNESVKRNIAASLFMQRDSSYKRIQELQSLLAATDIALNKQKFSSSPDSGIVQAMLADKQRLEEMLLQKESAVKIKNPQYTSWLSHEVNITAEEMINRILLENMGMLEYFAGDSATYLFSASKGKPLSFVKLSPGLQEAANNFLHFFSDRNQILNKPAEYALSAHALYSYLFATPPAPGSSSLLIIPDGFISLIPFDALLTAKATTTGIASFPFLIKQYQTNYSFSCKTILAQKQISNKPGKDIITAFAPVFANKERGFQTLQHSAEELDAIKTFYPAGKFYMASSATLQQFKSDCSHASIIHLATHASAGTDSAIGGIEFYDSTLYLNNIYSLPLKAKLVVLSGCETGAGAVNKTEGLMSLARGFSYAGTQNVVAGLWQTEDKTSGELFRDFYNSFSSSTISGALQNAKLKIIQNSSVSQSSPFYWAGYTYIGIPGEKLSDHSNKNIIPYIVIAILFTAGVVIMLRKKRTVNRTIS